jgi:hypothetical protein
MKLLEKDEDINKATKALKAMAHPLRLKIFVNLTMTLKIFINLITTLKMLINFIGNIFIVSLYIVKSHYC